MASAMGIAVLPFSAMKSGMKHRCRVLARSSAGEASVIVQSGKNEGLIKEWKGGLKRRDEENKRNTITEELAALWDDGYGTQTVQDFFEAAKEMNVCDSGPPRWFSPVECGTPLNDSPTLLYLPGIDGTGLGLIVHHKALGKAFEVRCMHIPFQDRTPLEGLIKFVEEAVQYEHALSPKKPVYLVGDSFGACLALAVAARNPTLDLMLILVNPGTSFDRSQLPLLLPILEACPDGFKFIAPFLSFIMAGDPVRMATVNIQSKLPPMKKIEHLLHNLTSMLPCLPELAKILPKDTLIWKLELLKSAAAYANSRLHAVEAEVLMIASGNDKVLPSGDEAKRLASSLQKCKVRLFEKSGHALLFEDGIGLLTIIRGTCMYRRSNFYDLVMDYVPPSMQEFNYIENHITCSFRSLIGSVTFSTMEDGKIVKGLGGVPDEGPVLLVGYHNFLGTEIVSIAEDFLSEKGIMIRGISHNQLFTRYFETPTSTFGFMDWLKIFGGVPVSGSYLYKLLSTKSHVLLFPGGSREALHLKGEQYKLIWPNRQEFVRMAANFGATIVPFGVVGEDDITKILLDYKELMKIPIVSDSIRNTTRHAVKIRDESAGEVANQNMIVPLFSPKLPGRYYFLYGKPIRTKGREKMLKDKRNAEQLYQQVQSEVKNCLNYLIKKREEDPYRSLIDRKLYQATYLSEPPAFDP